MADTTQLLDELYPREMEVADAQVPELVDALLSAYPDKDFLYIRLADKWAVRVADDIVGTDGPGRLIVRRIVEYARSDGRLLDLLGLAWSDKPGNLKLKAMAEAKNHIHIEFYIVRDDDLGSRLQHLMIEKAKQGVKVRLLYDGIGSHRLGKDYLKRLRDAGVETGCFLPPLRSFFDQRINYRNHRKIVVVDGKVGFFGGLNVGDEYIGNDSKIGYWRDTHFRIMGDAVCWLQYTFVADWHFVKGRLLTEDEFFPMQANHGEEWVQVLKCGPDEPRNRIPELLFTCMVSAKKRIYVESPYLIPDPGMLMALKTAAIHGVDVRIIIPTVPDTMIVYCATLSYAQELLNAGVRIYRYKKGFIHAKVFVADHLAFSGSTNMDMRSFYGQFEINAVFFDGKVVNRLVEDFYTDLKESKEMSLSDFEKRPTMQKLKEAFARLLSPLF